jgi:hypothetical protein
MRGYRGCFKRAAGQVENLLGLAAQTKYDRPKKLKELITKGIKAAEHP